MNLITDAINMIRDIRGIGGMISMWGGLLNMSQLLGGLVFITKVEGLAVLITVLIMLMIAGQIHKRTPFSRLTGLCQLPWLILMPWLVYRLITFEHAVYFQAWGWLVATLMAISLAFVALDVYRYSRGHKQYSWSQ
ncbi:MAG: hypothetical protein AAF702_50350 [Chloroflexota bacterium]